MLATIYMRVFLKESLPARDGTLRQPILKGGSDAIEEDGYSPETIEAFKKVPSARDLICLLRSR